MKPKTSNTSSFRLLTSAALVACAAAAAGLIVGPGLRSVATERQGANLSSTVAAETKSAPLTLPQAIAAARESVLMLGTLDAEGGFEQIGTGFAVEAGSETGVVATAAHVAERLSEAIKSGHAVVARRPRPGTPEDFKVAGKPIIHPGYERWRSINDRKLIARTTGGFERIRSMIPADVALVSIEGELDAGLAIASASRLGSLASGESIIYLGFPAENICGQKSNVPATAGFGHIQSLSGIMFEPAAPDASLVIQHDILLTGGSSGGPLLVADPVTGRLEVIGAHTAASHVFVSDARVPVAKGYGQRSDLIRELVEGVATAAQDSRDDVWADELRSVTLSGDGRLAEVQRALNLRYTAVSELERFQVDLAIVPAGVREIEVQRGISYTFVATGDNWDDVNISLSRDGTELTSDLESDAMPVVTWKAPFTGTVQLSVSAATTYGQSSAQVRILRVWDD